MSEIRPVSGVDHWDSYENEEYKVVCVRTSRERLSEARLSKE